MQTYTTAQKIMVSFFNNMAIAWHLLAQIIISILPVFSPLILHMAIS